MANLAVNYIKLPTKYIAKIKEFFTTPFGYSFTDFGDEYTAFDKQSSSIDGGFYQSELCSSQNTGAALIVLYTENLEHSYQVVQENGGIITTEIFAFPGGRRFHFTEPSSNELAIWSRTTNN